MDARLHVLVYGDVQGVFFRAGTVSEARRIGGISGWVRNRPDGAVEVVAEGGRDALEKLLEWCSHGPSGASVSQIKNEWGHPTGEFTGFSVRF